VETDTFLIPAFLPVSALLVLHTRMLMENVSPAMLHLSGTAFHLLALPAEPTPSMMLNNKNVSAPMDSTTLIQEDTVLLAMLPIIGTLTPSYVSFAPADSSSTKLHSCASALLLLLTSPPTTNALDAMLLNIGIPLKKLVFPALLTTIGTQPPLDVSAAPLA